MMNQATVLLLSALALLAFGCGDAPDVPEPMEKEPEEELQTPPSNTLTFAAPEDWRDLKGMTLELFMGQPLLTYTEGPFVFQMTLVDPVPGELLLSESLVDVERGAAIQAVYEGDNYVSPQGVLALTHAESDGERTWYAGSFDVELVERRGGESTRFTGSFSLCLLAAGEPCIKEEGTR